MTDERKEPLTAQQIAAVAVDMALESAVTDGALVLAIAIEFKVRRGTTLAEGEDKLYTPNQLRLRTTRERDKRIRVWFSSTPERRVLAAIRSVARERGVGQGRAVGVYNTWRGSRLDTEDNGPELRRMKGCGEITIDLLDSARARDARLFNG